MATSDEIRRRVEEADTVRCAQRATAAQQVGELALRRAAVARQLEDIERELGDILAAATEVIGIDELAQFTDVKAADLTRWLTAHKPVRTKRKKPTNTPTDMSREPAGPGTPPPRRTSPRPASEDGVPHTPERIPAPLT
jgi:hypothetical protein